MYCTISRLTVSCFQPVSHLSVLISQHISLNSLVHIFTILYLIMTWIWGLAALLFWFTSFRSNSPRNAFNLTSLLHSWARLWRSRLAQLWSSKNSGYWPPSAEWHFLKHSAQAWTNTALTLTWPCLTCKSPNCYPYCWQRSSKRIFC